jgi:PAS domain S-box-containing protein
MAIETEQQKVGQSMERLLRLQRVTRGLSRALTPTEVASVIVLEAGPALGAAECSVYLEEDGELRRVEGVEPAVPIAETARRGTPVWVESQEAPRGQRAWASLPLEVEGRVLGVLALGFEREQCFEPEDKAFACVVAQQCAYALERAHLYARERALREGEAVFRRLMESDMMGLAFCDEGGRILQANEAFLSLVGHHADEVTRGELQWRALVPPEGREAGDRALKELWSRGMSSAFELELLRGDGSRVQALTGSARVEEQARMLSFVLDLSDLKRAEGALRFLATASRILGQSPEVPDATLQHVACLASVSVASWCVIDLVEGETGTVRRAAAAHRDQEQEAWLRETWPLPRPKDGGGPLLDTMHSGEPLLFADFCAELWRHLSPEAEPMLRPEGWEACSVVVVPLRSHEGALGLLTLGACTPPQRRYGAEDVAMGRELAYRVATALEGARLFQDAQRAVRLRDDFLAVASHELKTPLTPLRLHLQGLRRVVEASEGLPVEAGRVLRAVHGCEAQVRKLAGLVDDLLDVSRLAKGRLSLHLEPVDLLAVMRDVVEQLAPEAARAGCRVEVGEGPPVVGRWDRVRLEQVVTNLLTNALKYGARKPVLLRAWREGALARLLVRDEGIGIAPEHRARIFGKFERAVSDRHYGGLGLGLHITQQIVHALGGEMGLESEPGRGASFTVVLPLEGAPRGREAEEERLPP